MNNDTETDHTSWNELRHAATGVNERCAREMGRRYKRGWMNGGDEGRILVRVGWVGSGVGDDGEEEGGLGVD